MLSEFVPVHFQNVSTCPDNISYTLFYIVVTLCRLLHLCPYNVSYYTHITVVGERSIDDTTRILYRINCIIYFMLGVPSSQMSTAGALLYTYIQYHIKGFERYPFFLLFFFYNNTPNTPLCIPLTTRKGRVVTKSTDNARGSISNEIPYTLYIIISCTYYYCTNNTLLLTGRQKSMISCSSRT